MDRAVLRFLNICVLLLNARNYRVNAFGHYGFCFDFPKWLVLVLSRAVVIFVPRRFNVQPFCASELVFVHECTHECFVFERGYYGGGRDSFSAEKVGGISIVSFGVRLPRLLLKFGRQSN